MAEAGRNAYATTAANAAAGTPNVVAVVNDGTGDRQIMAIGAGDGTTPVAKVSTDGGLNVAGTQPAVSSTAWTSATTVNTVNTISVTGYNTVTVAMSNTSTMTGGVLTFEVSPDNTNWFALSMARIDSYTVETTYTLSTVANRAWSTSVDGFTNFRVRLSTIIAGTGTATVLVTAQTFAIEPIVSVGQATAANLNATVTATNLSTNEAQINGVAPLMGNGISGTGAQRVTPASDATLNTNMTWNNGVVGAGVQRMTVASDSTGQMAPAANATATGCAISYTAALVATKVAVKASAGNLYGYHIYNPNSAVIYVQMFNVASASVTLGTTPPTMVLAVPAGGWADATPSGPPITFNTAITIAATTTASGLTAPTTGLLTNIWYL